LPIGPEFAGYHEFITDPDEKSPQPLTSQPDRSFPNR